MSEGSNKRPYDTERFNNEFDRIFKSDKKKKEKERRKARKERSAT